MGKYEDHSVIHRELVELANDMYETVYPRAQSIGTSSKAILAYNLGCMETVMNMHLYIINSAAQQKNKQDTQDLPF
jgi:hypothetical protein